MEPLEVAFVVFIPFAHFPPDPDHDPELYIRFSNPRRRQWYFREDIRKPTHGASIAWLAHLDLIKYVVQSGLDTTLIVEDDVDWDVSIRSQMVQIANSVRNLTKANPAEPAPYGREWDVLWIGHCGDVWDDKKETVFYDDPTVGPAKDYSGWAKPSIERLPPFQRGVFRSFNPVCSFAYALSRDGAEKVLRLAGAGQDEAFDISMMHGCQRGKLSCITVIPEVVHQYFPNKSFGVKSLVDIGNGQEAGPYDAEFESVMGSTENILESARCRALWNKKCPRE